MVSRAAILASKYSCISSSDGEAGVMTTPNAQVQPRAERAARGPSAGTRCSASLQLAFKCIELFCFDDDPEVVRDAGN